MKKLITGLVGGIIIGSAALAAAAPSVPLQTGTYITYRGIICGAYASPINPTAGNIACEKTSGASYFISISTTSVGVTNPHSKVVFQHNQP